MSNRLTFELVDKTIRFLCNDNDRPFGGKVVIIGGDFKQCLPIVQNGNRAAVIQACIKSSRLWNLFQHYRLQTNMRVRPEEQDFIRWLERLGNNTLPTLNDRLRPNSIEIPQECVTETLEDLIQNIFGDLRPGQVLNRAILTPLNENYLTELF
ncbi:PIF1-like helicase [Popillia japonica]|uniref:ATP-dependent DNA helicase n=1 Tax=Popillia japonica TaxID=7064 RepID=A0AAW1HUY7_POPJA